MHEHQPHVLLAAAARSLSLREILALSEEAAFALFREARWGPGGDPVCPTCGALETHWFLPSRRQWRCHACGHTFSLTAGTLFAHPKLPLSVYLGAIALYTNAVNGLSALQRARDLTVQDKSACVRMHKLRESLMVHRDETPLSGEVQIDGGDVGGSVRPENRAEDRVDRRLVENRNPDRRCVVVVRETFPADDPLGRVGAQRTLTAVVERETQADIGALAKRWIAPGTVVSADASDADDLLHGASPTRRVNHREAYRAEDGTTNHQAESYSSRLRRMPLGQHHTFGLSHLANDAQMRPTARTPAAGPTGRSSATSSAHAPARPRTATGAVTSRAIPAARSAWGLSPAPRRGGRPGGQPPGSRPASPAAAARPGWSSPSPPRGRCVPPGLPLCSPPPPP